MSALKEKGFQSQELKRSAIDESLCYALSTKSLGRYFSSSFMSKSSKTVTIMRFNYNQGSNG